MAITLQNRSGGESAALRRSASSAAARRDRRPTLWPTGCWESAAAKRSPPETALQRLRTRRHCRRAFAVQLVQRLRDQDPKVTPALLWLDRRLLAQGTTADEIVREEHHGQGAMNVTVRNVITSMRLMSAVDWAEFFESVSQVDAVLRADSDFAAMDFPTRDLYRHAIEELARGSRPHRDRSRADSRSRPPNAPPLKVPNRGGDNRSPRAGSRLLPDLGRAPGARERDRIPRAVARADRSRQRRRRTSGLSRNDRDHHRDHRHPAFLALWESGVSGWTGITSRDFSRSFPPRMWPVALVNRAVTIFIGPTTLPGLELHDGVPAALRTMRRGAHASDNTARRSRSRSSAWRFIIWRARTATFASPCSRTGPIPRLRLRPATTSCSARPPPRSRG